MGFCPKCGYERQTKDDDFVPMTECPKCGIVYEKFTEKQRRLNEAGVSIYERNNKRKHPSARNFLIWFLVTFVFIIALNILNRADTDINVNKKDTVKPIPQEQKDIDSPSKSLDSVTISHTNNSTSYNSAKEVSDTIDRISKAYDERISDSKLYHNNISTYGWETLKTNQNYKKAKSMLYNYRIQHTYMDNDFFVCVDMAIDIWNLLTTAGIRAKLMIGNIETDIAYDSKVIDYLSKMSHAWILAEISPSTWIPMETTGGYIVEPSMPNFSLYNKGTMFDNPKEYKDFNTSRNAMFDTCNETVSMRDNFNRQFAGKPITTEATEYTGRMKQKLDDCKNLVGKVTALLRQ